MPGRYRRAPRRRAGRRPTYRKPKRAFARRRRRVAPMRQVNVNPAGFRTIFNAVRAARPIWTTRTYLGANTMSGSGTSVTDNIVFDPSATLTVPYPSAPQSQHRYHGFPDWTSYKLVYSQYRVTKIKIFFTLTTNETTDSAIFPELFVRFNYNPDQGTPGTDSLSEINRWTRFNFSNDHRVATYTVYPRVHQFALGTQTLEVVPGGGIDPDYVDLTTLPQLLRKPGWIDMDKPVIMYGLMLYILTLSSGQAIRMDHEYHMGFRSQV